MVRVGTVTLFYSILFYSTLIYSILFYIYARVECVMQIFKIMIEEGSRKIEGQTHRKHRQIERQIQTARQTDR